MDNFWDDVNMWIYGVASALAGGVILLIRKILTNEKKIELLEFQLKNLTEDVGEMKSDIKSLIRRNVRVDE
jgi:hypothetical protein